MLGPILAQRGEAPLDAGGPKQRAVLGVLVANIGSLVSSGTILTAIWGEDAPESHRRSLHTYVSNLRALLDIEIVRAGDSYRIDLPPDQVDAVVFEESLEQARGLVATDPVSAGEQLRAALAMWRGRPYADVAYVEGLQTEIQRLEELRLAAVEARLDADLAAGRHENVLAEVAALAEEYPLRERFRAQHMVALYRSGRQADALSAYERTRLHLSEELGLEPSQELQDLELSILQHESWLQHGIGRSTTHRLVFLASEIRDAEEIWDRNPQAMAEALAVHDRIAIETIESRGGNPFRVSSEGTVASFSDMISAVQAAEEIQRSLGAAEWSDAFISIGMGLDIGEAESRGGDFVGPPVTRACRLASAANGGQILISSAMHTVIADTPRAGLQVKQLGEHDLAGFATIQRVGQLVFDDLPHDFPDLRSSDLHVDPSLPPALPGYEIREEIGSGTLSRVYRAYQPSVGREVAIKIVPPRLASHPQLIHRFEAGARTIAQLAHPRIVPLIDFWRDPGGAYLVSHLISGRTLQDAIDAGNLDNETTYRVLQHVGEALDHAHSLGIAHGDLKPADILLDDSGNAYVTDFGIAAKLLNPELMSAVSHDTGFSAPEQPVSPASDIYALGVISRHLIADPDVGAVIDRATATDPADRYPDAASFLADLRLASGQEPPDTGRTSVTRNPFKGLRPFDVGDSADFFGRSALIEELVQAVADHRLVAVVGPSGSGKSSVVRAGMLPSVASGEIPGSENWLRLTFSPGHSPVDSLSEIMETIAAEPMAIDETLEREGIGGLARHLASDSRDILLLVVDQFEELYTLVNDDDLRQRFLDMLIAAVTEEDSNVRAVLTLRADFYDRPLKDPKLGPLVRNGLVTVVPPTRDELIEMITGPTRAAGLRWEVGLPGRIAEDVARQPGGLPLLQYALTELVEQRTGDILSRGDYERVGGVTGALSTRAETVFSQLSPQQQEAARDIFLRLVSVDEETTDTRRRVRRSELTSIGFGRSDVDAVVDSYIAERLLLADRDPVTRGPTVEVAHEALIREWPRLGVWIDEDRDGLLLGRRFRMALKDWDDSDRQSDYLLVGSRLAPFLQWGDHSSLTLVEREFFELSKDADQETHQRERRRRRNVVSILAAAALIGIVLAILAVIQANRADRNADLARSRELAASAINVLDNDPALSKLLAIAAAQIADPPVEAVSALHEAYLTDRVVDRYLWPSAHQVGALWTDIHPYRRLVVASGSGPGTPGELSMHLEVADLDANEVLWSFDVSPGAGVGPAFFTPDGSTVIAGVFAHPGPGESPSEVGIHLFDAESGTHLRRFDFGPCGALVSDLSDTLVLAVTVSGSPDRCFLEAEVEFQIETIDLTTGRRSLITKSGLSTESATVVGLTAALSDDGTRLAYESVTNNDTRQIVVIDTETGSSVLEFDPDLEDRIPFIHDLNRDGSLLLYGLPEVQVRSVDTNEVLVEFQRFRTGHAVAAFGPDGTSIYVTGPEADVRRIDITSGEREFTVPAAGSGPISTGGDGLVLVTDPASGTANLISESTRGEVMPFAVDRCFIATGGIVTTGDSMVVLQGCIDRIQTQVLDVETGRLLHTLPGAGGQSIDLSPDGERFVRQTGSAEGLKPIGPLEIRDLRSGDQLVQLKGFCVFEQLNTVPPPQQDGCSRFPDQPFAFFGWQNSWTPDGEMVISASMTTFTGTAGVAVWDADTGELIHTRDFGADADMTSMVFTPDSRRVLIALAGRGGSSRIHGIDLESWNLVAEANLAPDLGGADRIGLIGYSSDGSLIAIGGLAGQGGGSIHWLDPETLEVLRSIDRIHEGAVRGGSISPGGDLIATSATDGLVRVWDLTEGRLVHQIPVEGGSVQAVDFLNGRHIVIGTSTGLLLTMTIDTAELVEIVSASLTRGFTATECQRFNFDTCPSLDELRGG